MLLLVSCVMIVMMYYYVMLRMLCFMLQPYFSLRVTNEADVPTPHVLFA